MINSSDKVVNLAVEGLSQPRVDMPYYHIRCRMKVEKAIRVKSVFCGREGSEGKPVFFRVLADGAWMENGAVRGGEEAALLVRCDWQPREKHQVRLEWNLEGEEAAEEMLVVSEEAPDSGGYWDIRWKDYRPIVVRETQGLERESEPVDVSIAVPPQEVGDLAKELRLVEVQPDTGEQREVPSQPYAIVSYEPRVEGAGEASIRCNIAFLATVPAGGARIYLAFYGNPEAEAPQYETDLEVNGEGEAPVWENSKVRYRFQEGSGQLLDILIKSEPEKRLCHSRSGGAAMHWNPDCYSMPRPWAHTFQWKVPETAKMSEIRGAIFVQSTRWGHMQPDMPEVFCWVTYRLFARNAELYVSSQLEVVQDINVTAIRNDEMVLDSSLVSHYAFEDSDGKVEFGPLGKGEVIQPGWIGPISLEAPWVCLYNPESELGFATIRLRHSYGHRYGKPACTDKAGTYIHFPNWGITYWFRAYVVELTKERPLLLEEGAFYSEQNAYLPVEIGDGDEAIEGLRRRATALRIPLAAQSEVDI